MSSQTNTKGGFTLPGEAGYEKLTLELARRWGADVIRDSDGTKLSDEILNAGYGIYSTICPIREHNDWISQNADARQQTFLSTAPVCAQGEALEIKLMEGFFDQQFEIDSSAAAMKYWQVYDRTDNSLLCNTDWSFSKENGTVRLKATPFHLYTVSFMAWRIWEEISMYNSVTNNWTKEHLMQLNPYLPKAQEYICSWLSRWCLEHKETTVVRFTSLYYNFVWIWGSQQENRHLFSDWASYDFTISTAALDDFAKEYGYSLTAEDFINKGFHNAAHRVPSKKMQDWMSFISAFVRKTAKKQVDIVHKAGKQAYVFYDDSWVGLEPYNGYFEEFGFDGIIKCVFSGYEVRLCAGVKAKTHEIRFHPYLFPVGLGGMPTFAEGGHPGKDAFDYWTHTRRALLREEIQRAGLGGYLHLVQEYPDFIQAMDKIMAEFRQINCLHHAGKPYTLSPKIGVLTAWGSLRSWTLSGHFHETYMHSLIHVLESLSGLAFDVSFISFDDIKNGACGSLDVIINAGQSGDAWSGGEHWQSSEAVELLTKWVYNGGVFLGINEPSGAQGGSTNLRMAHVLGVDIDNGEYACHGKWQYKAEDIHNILPKGISIKGKKNVRLTGCRPQVLAQAEAAPSLVINSFGKGKGVYLSSFNHDVYHTRLLQNLILYGTSGNIYADGTTDNFNTECAVYPDSSCIAVINNSDTQQSAVCKWKDKAYSVNLQPYEMQVLTL